MSLSSSEIQDLMERDEYDIPTVPSADGKNLLDLEDVDNMGDMEKEIHTDEELRGMYVLDDEFDEQDDPDAAHLSSRQDRKRRQFQRSGD